MSKRKNKPRVAITFDDKRVVVRPGLGCGLFAALESKDERDAMGKQRWKCTPAPRVLAYQDGTSLSYWSRYEVESLLARIFARLAEVKRLSRRRSKKGGAS